MKNLHYIVAGLLHLKTTMSCCNLSEISFGSLRTFPVTNRFSRFFEPFRAPLLTKLPVLFKSSDNETSKVACFSDGHVFRKSFLLSVSNRNSFAPTSNTVVGVPMLS